MPALLRSMNITQTEIADYSAHSMNLTTEQARRNKLTRRDGSPITVNFTMIGAGVWLRGTAYTFHGVTPEGGIILG